MPELPEVELTRRHLATALVSRQLVSVSTTHPRTARHNSGPGEVDSRLSNRTVLSVGRVGKFLVVPLDDGESMVAHLGMSGRFWVGEPGEVEPDHTHFRARLDSGREVRFIDPRTFGFIAVFDEDEMARSGVGRLGPDAWEATPSVDHLVQRLSTRTAPIKALLLDQSVLAGLGNIYADEALHIAGIHPLRPGNTLTLGEIECLLGAVRMVLEGAIENGGTSLDDLAYLLPDGRAGDNLDQLLVYGRAGSGCTRCGGPVERMTIRGRTAHFCPQCQV